MSDESAKSGSWSRGRWWFVVVLIFAVHIGLIFAFGDRKPIVPRQPAFTPELRMITGGHEMLALNDPTLFALPHLNGFSGVAWLQSQLPRIEPEPFRVTEAPRWLLLPVERLGEAFSQFMKTNQFAEFSPELKPAPFLRVPELSLVNSVSGAKSGLRIEGDLALRKLAHETGGRVLYPNSFGQLNDVYAEVYEELRNQYTIGYISTNTLKDGSYRHIQVKVEAPGAVISARPGYYAPTH